jgi:hypothetical protein
MSVSSKNIRPVTIDPEQVRMLKDELGKVRCWLSGYAAAKGHDDNLGLMTFLPGGDSLRRTQLLLGQLLMQARKAPPMPADPVHQHEGAWWFWDETWTPERHGPYTDEAKCRFAYRCFVFWLETGVWPGGSEPPTISTAKED